MDGKRMSGDPNIADQTRARETPAIEGGENHLAGDSPSPTEQDDTTAESDLGRNGMSENDIRKRAYEIWEAEERPDGGHERHWLQAEQELKERSTERG